LALTSAVTTAINCNGGKATVTIVTGGTAPYSYTFNSTTNRSFTDVSAGTDYLIALPMRKVVDQ
jgi:hypothetical protein